MDIIKFYSFTLFLSWSRNQVLVSPLVSLIIINPCPFSLYHSWPLLHFLLTLRCRSETHAHWWPNQFGTCWGAHVPREDTCKRCKTSWANWSRQSICSSTPSSVSQCSPMSSLTLPLSSGLKKGEQFASTFPLPTLPLPVSPSIPSLDPLLSLRPRISTSSFFY